MSELLKKVDFDRFLNQIFKVHTENGVQEVELFEVLEMKSEFSECFSLLFKVPKDKFFIQKLYKVTHPELGDFELFLVPVIQRKTDALYYEAVFNRLIDE